MSASGFILRRVMQIFWLQRCPYLQTDDQESGITGYQTVAEQLGTGSLDRKYERQIEQGTKWKLRMS